MNFSHVQAFGSKPRLHSSFESMLQQGLIEHRRLMKGKEDLFSRQQFICVYVFVPPSSVLQIFQLCEKLKGVESTLSAPISSLRFVPPTYTQTATHRQNSLSHFVLSTFSLSVSLFLSLISSIPPALHLFHPLS